MRRVRGIDFAVYENQEPTTLLATLAPTALAVVDDCLYHLDSIAEPPVHGSLPVAESQDPSVADKRADGCFFNRIEGMVVERHAVDIAILGGFELRQKRGSLERLQADRNTWQIIASIDGSLRKVLKVATALHAVCRDQDNGTVLSFDTELRIGLQVRAMYAVFRGQLAGLADLHAPADAKLRRAATAIASLVGLDAYSKMRIGDRFVLHQLRERIVACLREPRPAAATCKRLNVDLANFAELLRAINQRQELVEHDRQLIESLLSCDRPDATRLSRLVGLDDRLDFLLEIDAPWEETRPRLRRLLTRLTSHSGSLDLTTPTTQERKQS